MRKKIEQGLPPIYEKIGFTYVCVLYLLLQIHKFLRFAMYNLYHIMHTDYGIYYGRYILQWTKCDLYFIHMH